jgi:hypothetical protein
VNIAPRILIGLCLLAAVPVSSRAQTPEPPLHRLELAGGIGISGSMTLGARDGDLRSSASGPYRLFRSSTRQDGAPVLDLHAGFDLTRRWGLQAHMAFGRPEVQTSLSDDAEGAPAITAVEQLDHYLIDGGVVFRLHELDVKGIQPFVTGGAGYLRQLHEGRAEIEEGSVYHVGGGARYWFSTSDRGLFRATGLRGDVRLNILSGGISLDGGSRRYPSLSGSFFVMF